MLLKEIIQLLDHQHLLDLGGKPADQLVGKRIGPAEFQDRGLGPDFPRILVGDAAGDNAQARIRISIRLAVEPQAAALSLGNRSSTVRRITRPQIGMGT